MEQVDSLFDSSEIHFNIIVFLKQVILHLFCPFFLWFSPNLYVQGFLELRFLSIFFNWFLHALLIIMVSISYSYEDELGSDSRIIFIPFMLLLSHRFMVALKYATMSNTGINILLNYLSIYIYLFIIYFITNIIISLSEYYKLMNCNDKKRLDSYKDQLQIISGLLSKNPVLIDFQISSSATSLSFDDISQISIKIEDINNNNLNKDISNIKVWNQYILESFSNDNEYIINENENELYKDSLADKIYTANNDFDIKYINIPISIICTTFLLRATKFNLKYRNILNLGGFICIFFLCIQVLIREFDHNIEHVHLFQIHVFYLSFIILTLSFGVPIVLFLTSAVVDALVRKRIAIELGLMIQTISKTNYEQFGFKSFDNLYSNRKYVADNLQNMKTDRIKYYKISNIPDLLVTNEIKVLQISRESISRESSKNSSFAGIFTTTEYNNKNNCNNPLATPRLLLDNVDNVVAYIKMWRILHDYGKRFRFRLDIYLGLICFLAMVVGILVILSLSNDSTALKDIVFQQAQVLTFILIFYVITIILISAGTNHEYNLHSLNLSTQILDMDSRININNQTLIKIKQKLLNNNNSIQTSEQLEIELLISKYKDIYRSLISCLTIIENTNKFSPIKFLFLNVNYALAYSIIVGMTSFFIYIFSQILNN